MKLGSLGAPGRTRTADPRITNALLYQLSHGSIFESGSHSQNLRPRLAMNKTEFA